MDNYKQRSMVGRKEPYYKKRRNFNDSDGRIIEVFQTVLRKQILLLSYKTIYESYGLKDEAPEFKDRIYQSIKLLRKDLIGFGITIRSVRGRGYELIFQ